MPRGGNNNGNNGNQGNPDSSVKPTTGTDDNDDLNGGGKINGGDGNDIITGSDGIDKITAGDGDDRVTGGAGDDTMYGNDGWDTAVFSGDVRDYSFADGRGNSFIVSGQDGTDTLKHFEELEFDNHTIYLDGRNNTQIVEDHTLTVSEDGSASIEDLLSGSWDFEGDELTVVSVSDGAVSGAEFTFDASGRYDYLAVGETATEEVTFTVTDGTNVTTNTVTVTIEGENDATVTVDDSGTSDEDGTASGNVLDNDSDVDASDVLSVANAGIFNLTYGTLTVNADGSWSFTPNADAQTLDDGDSVSESVTLDISDGHGIVTSELTITVTGSNDAPEVMADTGSTDEDSSVSGNLLDNDSDIDAGDTLSVANAGSFALSYADVTVNPDGSWSATPNDNAHSLAEGESSSETITIDVTDGDVTISQDLTITVTGNNDAPEIDSVNSDLQGNVTAEPASLVSEAQPFTVEQYLGATSTSLSDLQNYAANNEADYTVQTNVIDYTDDPAGFAGELPGSNPWPAEADTGLGGTGSSVNNNFFARITTTFTVAEGDTFTFRTFNDDGVFLMIDGQLIINDPGIHPERAFEGAIYLEPGEHTLELYFFEFGGEASLELSVRNSSGEYGLLGGEDSVIGGTSSLTDSGVIHFSDVDLSDSHSVSSSADGSDYLGTFTAVMGANDTVDWDFSVSNDALVSLGAGETITQTYTVTVTDNNGATVSETVSVTMTGTNEDPILESSTTNGSVTEAENNSADENNNVTHAASGVIAFSDADASDVHSVSVSANGANYRGQLTATVSESGEVTWIFEVADSDLDDMNSGDVESQSYTVTIDDGHGGTITETVTITLNGADDNIAPVAVDDNLAGGDAVVIGFDDLSGTYTAIPTGYNGFDWSSSNSGYYYNPDLWYGGYGGAGGGTNAAWTAYGGQYSTMTWQDEGTVDVDGAYFSNDYGVPNLTVRAYKDGELVATVEITDLTYGRNWVDLNFEDIDTIVFDSGASGSPSRWWSMDDIHFNEHGTGADEYTVQTIDTATLLQNDTDAEGDTLAVIDVSATSASGATVTLNNDGTITYDPGEGFEDLAEGEVMTDTFTYTISDGNGGTSTATATVKVVGGVEPFKVFGGLDVDVESFAIANRWDPVSWTDSRSEHTSGDDVHVARAVNGAYAWLDDGFLGVRYSGYDFYEGNDTFIVQLGIGGQGYWSRSGIDMGDDDDVLAMDIDSTAQAGIDGYHAGAEFIGGNGNDDFRFDLDGATSTIIRGQKMYMGEGDDSIYITMDGVSDGNVMDGGNYFLLQGGNDTMTVEMTANDGALYNVVQGTYRGGDGNDTFDFTMTGEGSSANGFQANLYGDDGDDVFIFDVMEIGGTVNGGAGYDVIEFEMGSSSDYTITDNGDGTFDIEYDGSVMTVSDIEEIKFTDSDYLF